MYQHTTTDESWTKNAKHLAALLAIFFAAACYFYQVVFPTCCDVDSYLYIAKIYAKSGIAKTSNSDLRLFGYPLFLAIHIKLSSLLGIQLSLLVAISQVGLYFFSVTKLSRLISRIFSTKLGDIVYYSLVLNLFAYPYLTVMLTDGLSLILEISLVYLIILLLFCACRLHSAALSILGIAIGAILGFSVMVRPANIFYLAFVVVAVLCFSIRRFQTRPIEIPQLIAAAIVGFLILVSPQLVFNWTEYNHFSFLPKKDLGSLQIKWGKENLKYGTNMVGESPKQMFYPNSFFNSSRDPNPNTAEEELKWYWKNPVPGLKTIFMHCFGAVDIDYLFPYVYNLKPRYQPLLFLYSHSIIFWGAVGVLMLIRLTYQSYSRLEDRPHFFNLLFSLLLMSSLVLGWMGIYSLSAVENRFGLPLITMVLPIAIWALYSKIKACVTRDWSYLVFTIYLGTAWFLSQFLGHLKAV